MFISPGNREPASDNKAVAECDLGYHLANQSRWQCPCPAECQFRLLLPGTGQCRTGRRRGHFDQVGVLSVLGLRFSCERELSASRGRVRHVRRAVSHCFLRGANWYLRVYQHVLNGGPARRLPDRRPILVRARLVWEDDGEELRLDPGMAIFVQFGLDREHRHDLFDVGGGEPHGRSIDA